MPVSLTDAFGRAKESSLCFRSTCEKETLLPTKSLVEEAGFLSFLCSVFSASCGAFIDLIWLRLRIGAESLFNLGVFAVLFDFSFRSMDCVSDLGVFASSVLFGFGILTIGFFIWSVVSGFFVEVKSSLEDARLGSNVLHLLTTLL